MKMKVSLLALTMAFIPSLRQMAKAGNPNSKADTLPVILNIDINGYNDATYINWLAKETNAGNYYLLMKSTDGVNFSTLCVKGSHFNEAGIPILYCFTDTSFCGVRSFYKLYYVKEEPGALLFYSSAIIEMDSINGEEKMFKQVLLEYSHKKNLGKLQAFRFLNEK